MDYSSLKPGDNHYRAYIGPPLQYDFMGATQFRLLCTLGLRAHHRVLDLGCGSLRAGRFLINYLEPENYHGIEPNKWLIEDGIKEQVGDSLIAIKKPKFDYNSEFNTGVFGAKFDFIIAQSIFSHTGNDLIPNALSNIYESLNDNGAALLTFIKGDKDFEGNGWIYPECVEFTVSKVFEFAKNAGFQVQELPWYHPRQTWFYFFKNEEKRLKDEELQHLTGAVLHDKTFKKSVNVEVEQKGKLHPANAAVQENIKALICTGFHRSATSATANYLNKAGLHMGNELMGSSISNPKGHFEDWAAVRLHDEQLANNGTDWQYHGEVALNVEPGFLDSYIALRNSQHQCWGVKDPRACLFLDSWNEANGGNAHFLFVARHWSSCIESLLNRHSREFAHQLPGDLSDDKRLNFWRKPELAAKMWLEYNRKLLAFAKNNPSKTLVITQRALFNNAPLIQRINDKFSLNLDVSVESPVESVMLNDHASQTIPSMLSSHLKASLDIVWQELLELADLKHTEENANYYKPEFDDISQLPSEFVKSYQSACKDLAKKKSSSDVPTSDEINWPNEGSEEEAVVWIDKYPRKNLDESQLNKIHKFAEKHYGLSANVWLSMARLYQQKEQYESAINAFQFAITLGAQFPYIYMHLGQCYQRMGKPNEARFYLDKALNQNPNNAAFYAAKAQFLIEQGGADKAEQCLTDGIELLGYVPPLVIKLCDLLLNTQKLDGVEEVINSCIDQNHSALVSLKTRLALQTNYEKGVKRYNEQDSKKFANEDRLSWLASATYCIESGAGESEFVGRCYGYWFKDR
ncbi:tetratricopeptide repeat protein [Alteromonas alba]|uniref:tetratricopeptide repeat protein n=1 Tax=Alteromonas alba TaxID=2079529 RepID=UPI0011B23853|nr:tetratricopeptide repeat protein [Alteromonas alba]